VAKSLACQELVELVTDYLEGRLSRRDSKRFDAHIDGCEGCSAYLDQMWRTIRVTGRLTEEQIPEAAKAKLLDVFRDWKTA
jgi:predicted anti-sigma-YlaC factor YlaD